VLWAHSFGAVMSMLSVGCVIATKTIDENTLC